ncbi:helix-turn-helix domain-containing protein [Streptomyces sp. NPDC013953]|uniref:helix-turn-helix domain-containing protein n=1 Tax=Streptomyces sp. NPDC013953 TaxID=3364868 RepID=UPI0036F6FF46
MAEQKPSAAVRRRPRVTASPTHTGVTHIREHQPDRYTVIGNHLAQHAELSLVAIGLATHILSLPEGAAIDIRSMAARFPESRERIAFALRELEVHGYLRRARERTAAGRVITRTYVYDVPAPSAAVPLPPRAAGPRPRRRPAPVEPVPHPAPVQAVEPVVAAVVAAAPGLPEASGGARHDTAAALLVDLRRTDDRLTLSGRDVRRLAPAVTAWLDNGATPAAVHRTLTACLPADLRNPAGLLGHRLREMLPPPLPEGSARGPGAARPDPLQTCDTCDRAFRSPEPGRCRDCRPPSVLAA